MKIKRKIVCECTHRHTHTHAHTQTHTHTHAYITIYALVTGQHIFIFKLHNCYHTAWLIIMNYNYIITNK